MICGGLAGMVAKTVTNPLERIKMLSQTGEHGIMAPSSAAAATSGAVTSSTYTASTTAAASNSSSTSIVSIYRQILQKEGISGLWAGNGANLLRVFPAKAVVFCTQDYYKSFFRSIVASSSSKKQTTTDHHQPLPSIFSFLSGGLAGMTATAVTYPLDFARGRIAGKLAGVNKPGNTINTVTSSGGDAHGVSQKKHYHGIIRTLAISIKDEGILAVYKGMLPTLAGSMPYVGIQFGTVGVLERLFPVSHDNDSDGTKSKSSSSPFRKMIFGGCGGVMAGVLTYPNDTIRRMLQLQGSRGTDVIYTGYWDCVRQVVVQHGVIRLYRGFTVNLIRMAPNSAVQFGTYELLSKWTSSSDITTRS
jgi:solute carrier family 25 phosphate transporter 23/24/25/41